MAEFTEEILLVGSGYMGIEYAKVLNFLTKSYTVVGRGEESAKKFEKEINVNVVRGGIEKWIQNCDNIPQIAIIAASGDQIGRITKILIDAGIKKILLEKPGGIDLDDVRDVSIKAKEKKSEVYLAYNRRFYNSVIDAEKILEEDGGITSMTFEFTEWSHKIKDLKKPFGIKENWLYHNSSHVIDLAFYLGGVPVKMNSYARGTLDWHPAGSCFVGSGITDKNVLFSYHANWAAPGRWALEINTKLHRLIFRPMEELHVIDLGTVAVRGIPFDNTWDVQFKPGLYRQVKAFLDQDYKRFITIQEQFSRMNIYEKILMGNDFDSLATK